MSYTAYNLPDQVRGDTWSFEFIIQDQTSTPIDITGNEYWLTLKTSADLADEQAALQVGPLLASSISGSITFTIPGSDTITLEPRTYVYDFQEVTSQNKVNTLLIGKIKVVKDVTRSAEYDGTGQPIVPVSTSAGTAVYFGTTNSSDPAEIFLRDTALGRLGIQENSSIAFNVFITGKDKTTNESCSFQFNGAAERDGNTSQFIGTPGKIILGRENSLFNAQVVVNDSLNALTLIVTPASSNETVWAGRIDYTEVYY